MRNISQSALLEVRVPDPATRDQEADVASLREVEAVVVRLSDELRASAQRLASLRRAVLAAAFSGRLTGSGSDDEVIEETAATMPAPAASDTKGNT
jgi:type I restriction enzyme S subunit